MFSGQIVIPCLVHLGDQRVDVETILETKDAAYGLGFPFLGGPPPRIRLRLAPTTGRRPRRSSRFFVAGAWVSMMDGHAQFFR
jgi:hypothetical protein